MTKTIATKHVLVNSIVNSKKRKRRALSLRFLFCLFFPLFLHAHEVFIIVHGTWSLDTTWYTPGGDFFDALEHTAKQHNATVVPFCWNGKNSIEARQKAAHNLVKLIETYDKHTKITLIGHSHGGTVTILASQKLRKNKIFCLYTLGTPINPSIYPNMEKIDYYYNFFSFEDLIQPIFGIFDREHAPHNRIANIRIMINGKEPNHTDLHHAIVGAWLPQLHYISTHADIKMTEPGIIYFTNNEIPLYCHDVQRKELLERDRRLQQLILHSLPKKTQNK